MNPAIVARLVGFHVGKSDLPDMRRPSWMNSLDPICRECRVFTGEETPRELAISHVRVVESPKRFIFVELE